MSSPDVLQGPPALTVSEERWQALYEATPAMLASVDAQGRLVMVSDVWLDTLGYTRDEVLGRHTTDFMTPASRERSLREVMPAFFASGRCDKIEYQLVTRSGEIVDVLLSARLLRDQLAGTFHALAVLEDVTLQRRAERALEDERQRLAWIIDGTLAGTWEWHVPTGETRYNERWAAILGHRLADLQPTTIDTWRHWVHEADDARAMELLQRHFTGELPSYEQEVRARHQDGRWMWVLIRGRLMTRGADGSPAWMFGTLQDVTDRKSQEEALRTSRSFLDRSGRLAGVGGWQLDLRTGDVTWSDETRRIHGVDADYPPARNDGMHFYPPDVQPVMREVVEQAIRHGGGFDLEVPFIQGTGQHIWVRVVGGVEHEDGQPARVVGAFQDVTERVAERLALKQANERSAFATASGGIGIWDIDVQTGELTWDECVHRLHGSTPGGAIDHQRWQQMLHADDLESAQQAMREAVMGHQPLNTEFRVVWPDGSIHTLRTCASVSRDEDGRPLRMIGVNWDITESRRLEAELAEQHELLRVTLRSIGDAVITTDAEGHVVWLNPVAERMTGWAADEVVGAALTEVFHVVDEETRTAVTNPVAACLSQGEPVTLAHHAMLISRGGTEYGVQQSASPIRNDRGQVLGVVLVFHDVTEQRRLSGEMRHRATHDQLTGLVNRTEFDARLHQLLAGAVAERSEHALMYIDLDQFKLVNDACGHAVGDQLLQQVSKLLEQAVRAQDTLARLGGDEFGVILSHCSVEQAQRVAQQICERMEDFRFVHDGRRFRIGASIGLVPVDARWPNTAAILQAADTSCYAAKEAGRNRVHTWFDTDMAMRARHGQMQWATRIEQALDEDRFTLFAQRIEPLQLIEHGVRAEVLLRMVDVDGSLVPPGAFLPAAERFHLASRIDRWVLRHMIAWMKQLPSLDHIESVSLNLSGQSIGDRAFHRWAMEVLADAGPALCHCLCFEITETAAVTNMADAALFIEQVRAVGGRVALDDFGAGASSFGYLKTLPVDYLKIDGQFITDLIEDALDQAAVRCFADVARTVQVKTVAEFVDRADVLERLRELGVDYAQGFLVHRPAPVDQVLGLVGGMSAPGRGTAGPPQLRSAS